MTKIHSIPNHKLAQEAKAAQLRVKAALTCPLCGKIGPEDIGFLRISISIPNIPQPVPLPHWYCTKCGGAFLPKAELEQRIKIVRKAKQGGVILGTDGRVMA